MKEDRIFVDANIVIYAYDTSNINKHQIAIKIIDDLWKSGQGVLSTQVLQEFFVVITKKVPQPLDISSAKGIVEDLLEWDVVINDGKSILEAIEIHQKHKYSFWDSMIINAAVSGGAGLLLSEDLSDGHIVEGVTIENPFNYNSD